MKKPILVVGSPEPPYHPLDNLSALGGLLCDDSLFFTEDHDCFLRLREFGLLISYVDSYRRPLTVAQASALSGHLLGGGNALILHNGISLQDTPGLAEILGARFTHHPEARRLRVRAVEDHPVTAGVREFEIFDEPYHFEALGNLSVLAVYEQDGVSMPAAWERLCGRGRQIYLMPGHDSSALQCAEYARLIQNAVNYLNA